MGKELLYCDGNNNQLYIMTLHAASVNDVFWAILL